MNFDFDKNFGLEYLMFANQYLLVIQENIDFDLDFTESFILIFVVLLVKFDDQFVDNFSYFLDYWVY